MKTSLVPSFLRQRAVSGVSTAATVVALSALLAACSSAPETSAPRNPASTAAVNTAPAAAPATLTSHYWDLVSIRDAKGQVRSPVQTGAKPAPRLTFSEGRIVANRVCNTMSGTYRTDGNRLQVERLASTMIGCMDRDVVALEQLIGSQLPTMQSYALQNNAAGPQLLLSFADGSQWQLAGTATPETQYGSAGERIFLEVAPQRQACSHGVMPNHQCLRVREIRYNDGGLKTYTGEWQNFYDDIEGFTHQPGVHNVLRLKRYTRQHVPADASRYVYVLDMVVERGSAR